MRVSKKKKKKKKKKKMQELLPFQEHDIIYQNEAGPSVNHILTSQHSQCFS